MKTITKSVSPARTAIALACLALAPGSRAETPGPSKVDQAARGRKSAEGLLLDMRAID